MIYKALRTLIPVVLGLILVVSVAFAGMQSDNISTGNGTMMFFTTSEVVTADSTIDLPDATNGLVWLSDETNSGFLHVMSDGSLTKITSTGTVNTSSGNSNLSIYDNGTHARIENETGSNSTITVIYQYVP